MVDSGIPRKPTWLRQDAFTELLRRHGGVPRCAQTGATEHLTVDHIVPRWAGGTDDPSNLQFLVDWANVKKGIHPDTYWSQNFYWDQTPNLNAFRTAQRLLFTEIANSPWFARPISQITRRLYLNAWVVAAGKTLGMASAAWAVNHAVREHWGASPRTGCLLIVTKERAVRDQIAEDLRSDIAAYGIAARAPRVGVIEGRWQFDQQGWLEQQDAIVTTVQMIWEREKGITRGNLAEILARFPVIAFDEPHFAADQVSYLVEHASSSICFGFTGTPIDADGKLLNQMTALTVYGYDDASAFDQSLKWLNSNDTLARRFVREIGITEAQVIDHGQRGTTDDPGSRDYDLNIEPAKSVVRAVVDEMKRRDQLVLSAEDIAPHRVEAGAILGEPYAAHGMVVCDNVSTARTLCENTNTMFERDPVTYPPSEGWRAEVVHTDTLDEKGERVLGRPLTSDPKRMHPWLRAKSQGYAVDADCARLLFVVGIGREGVNNPACGPVGVATSQASMVEVVQRAIGRQLRAVTRTGDGGALTVPPAPLDSVLIITHAAFRNMALIARAIYFVCHMDEQLEGLPTLADLEDGDVPAPEVVQRGVTLTVKEKVDIAARCGDRLPDGGQIPLDDIVSEFAGLDTGPRVSRIRDWALKVRDEPESARREMRLTSRRPRSVLIVARENVRHDPDDDDLERHLKIHKPRLVERGYLPITEVHRELIAEMYADHASLFHLPPLTAIGNIESIRRDLAGRVLRQLGGHYVGEKNRVYPLIGAAVKAKLGVPEGQSAGKETDWDIPQVHALLRRPEVQSEITGWVVGRLIDEGLCPALHLLRSSEDA